LNRPNQAASKQYQKKQHVRTQSQPPESHYQTCDNEEQQYCPEDQREVPNFESYIDKDMLENNKFKN